MYTVCAAPVQVLHQAAQFLRAEAAVAVLEAATEKQKEDDERREEEEGETGGEAGGPKKRRKRENEGAEGAGEGTPSALVNARDKNGWTPLHAAVYMDLARVPGATSEGRRRLVAALLGARADPALRNNDGRTPVELARACGREDAVEALSCVSK